jgi:hypothetical protein
MFRKSSAPSIGHQVARMQRDFPSFRYQRASRIPTWTGSLQPFDTSPNYQIQVIYHVPKSPRVWVVNPLLVQNAPHLYPQDRSLCLYFPKDRSWTADDYLSETIIPWTALWLAFYELWLITGEWYGPEAPHSDATAIKRPE